MSHAQRTRRRFLGELGLGLGAGLALPGLATPLRAAAPGTRLKVAAIITEFSYRSHAHVIIENFLEPYLFNGKKTESGMDVVAMYVDQFPPDEMSREVSRQYKIPIYKSIPEALKRGGDTLAVDAVLSIGEHGKYPVNAKGQMEYPRKRFFDAIAGVIEEAGRPVPVFSDKHLSFRYDWAKEMYDTAVRLKIPFMAGSSVPLAERRPPLSLPAGAKWLGAVSVHGGGVESYGFHGLEVLQSMTESRKGGETGVSEVALLTDDALWKAADDGLWSTELADAAMVTELGPGTPTIRELVKTKDFASTKSQGLLVTYRDGLRGIVLRLGSSSTRWNFACQLEGEAAPRATRFNVGPWQNRNLFRALSHAIQAHFRDGKAPYPVERTLLTTGLLDAAMDSMIAGGKPIATPQLDIAYKAINFDAYREMGETWKIITDDTPEPKGIDISSRGRS
jgi:hypothetical protein